MQIEDIDFERYDCEEGLDNLRTDMLPFAKRALFKVSTYVRNYEKFKREPGESISAAVRRFRKLETSLKNGKVGSYPEATRCLKLLDGLHLDEKSYAQILGAAGNTYDIEKIFNALQFFVF